MYTKYNTYLILLKCLYMNFVSEFFTQESLVISILSIIKLLHDFFLAYVLFNYNTPCWWGREYVNCIPWRGGCPRGVMVKAMDYEIVVSKFIIQSRYYIHFQTNTLGKGMNPLILPARGTTTVLLGEWLWH